MKRFSVYLYKTLPCLRMTTKNEKNSSAPSFWAKWAKNLVEQSRFLVSSINLTAVPPPFPSCSAASGDGMNWAGSEASGSWQALFFLSTDPSAPVHKPGQKAWGWQVGVNSLIHKGLLLMLPALRCIRSRNPNLNTYFACCESFTKLPAFRLKGD